MGSRGNDGFSKLVRAARKRAGLTLRDVAEIVGHSVPYVSDIELGRRKPYSSEKIERLATRLGEPVGPMLAAAARERGAFEVPEDSSPHVVEAMAAMWRQLPDMTDEGLQELEDVIAKWRREK